MIAEFCSWCREYVVNKNLDCKECEDCLKCQYFDKECCMNKTVVSEYRREWNRPAYVLGIGPPLCRKYCPYLSDAKRRKAYFLSEGRNCGIGSVNEQDEDHGKHHTIRFTPLPKFWLNGDCESITFEVDFNETIYYHMTLLGWCEWEIPDRLFITVHDNKAINSGL